MSNDSGRGKHSGYGADAGFGIVGGIDAPSPRGAANHAFRGDAGAEKPVNTINIHAFLINYAEGFFAGVSAYPVGDGVYEMKAGFSRTANSSTSRFELTKSEILAVLDELKKPAHKRSSKNGQTITKYPALVIVLKQAEKDIDMYQRPEMLAYLKGTQWRKFGEDRAAKQAASARPTHLRVIK